jgi:hypothetical protein
MQRSLSRQPTAKKECLEKVQEEMFTTRESSAAYRRNGSNPRSSNDPALCNAAW